MAITDVVESENEGHLNGRNQPLGTFWQGPEAAKYFLFSMAERPDNHTAIVPAHKAIAAHLRNNDLEPIVLDFGCYYGESTVRAYIDIINNLPPSQRVYANFVGVDCVAEFIDRASENHSDVPGLQFLHVPTHNPLRMDSCFNAATMFFVDQVIPNNVVLLENYRKVYEALKPGGILTIIRLAEESFDRHSNYAFYGHTKRLNPNLSRDKFTEPQAFTNVLLVPEVDPISGAIQLDKDGTSKKARLSFVDYYRTRSVIIPFLANGAGFSHVQAYPLSKNLNVDPHDEIGNIIKATYDQTFKEVAKIYPEMLKSDDYKKPLLEIIIAVK